MSVIERKIFLFGRLTKLIRICVSFMSPPWVWPRTLRQIGAVLQLCDDRLLPRMEAPWLAASPTLEVSRRPRKREREGAARGKWLHCFHNLHNLFQLVESRAQVE